MTELLLRLLGARIDNAVNVADGSLAFRGGMGWAWFVLGLTVLGAAVCWMYRSSPGSLPPARKYTLAALRISFIALLLLLFLRPVLSLTVEGSVRRILVLLTDASSSMQIADPRIDQADQKRAAIARNLMNPAKGLLQPLDRQHLRHVEQVPRIDLVKGVLQNRELNLLPRLDREFDLGAFTFGEGVVEISARKDSSTNGPDGEGGTVEQFTWVTRLEAESPVTAMGDAIREVIHRKRGQPLAGIVLITDGANNSGSLPRDAAILAREEGLPLYVYGVGITSPRDIIVGNLFAPEVSFVDDQVPLTVRVRSQGMKGRSAELVLKLGGDVVARQTVDFAEDGEKVVPVAFTPRSTGEFELQAAIDPQPDEAVKDNNARSQRLKVIDTRIKVLMVEQSPRWEFRYLQAMLLRDRRTDLKCYLVESDPVIARGEDSPYLAQFPARKDELFKYDVVIWGDVDPQKVSAANLENLNELVSKFGGALIVIAGKRWTPHAYRRGLLEQMLPVAYDAGFAESAADSAADRPIRLELTSAGKDSPMLQLSDSKEENLALWEQLPPVYWVARVSRPKPAAEVLLIDPDPAKESRFGKMPVIALQQYGLGQVMYVGTDNTWRWRKNVGDLYYTTLWGQIAQRVSLPRLLGISKRTQLTSDRQNYLTGERVTVYARLYSAGYEPIQEPAVKGIYGLKNGQGPRPEVSLRSIPEQPGLYRGEFIAPSPGAYQFLLEHDPDVPLEFNVTEPRFEFGETAMNEPLLREMAAISHGVFFREEELHVLPDTILAKTERVRSPLEVELWSSPLYFLLLLAVVTVEWILRKWWNLK